MKTRFTRLLSKCTLKAAGIALLLLAGFSQNASAQAPANDECTGAIAFPTITAGGNCASVTANTANATQSLTGCSGTADDDVWYTFVCPVGMDSLIYENTTISGSDDHMIQVFTGTCGNLTSIFCSDPESGVITGLTAGTTYYLRIYTYFSGEESEVSVCLRSAMPQPVNDECAGAIAFPTILTDGSCASIIANTESATESQAGCTGVADDDIWYSFVCPAGTTSLFYTNTDISGSSDRVIQFFSGTCGALTSLECYDDENGSISGLTPGATYYLRIYSYDDGEPTKVSVCLQTAVINDEATGAIALSLGSGCTGAPYSNGAASQSVDEPFPNINGEEGFHTVWFKFIAPTSGMVKITNDYTGGTSDNDTKLGLFSVTDSSDYSTFTAIAGDDDNGVTIGSRSTIYAAGLTAGTTYYIAEDVYDDFTTPGSFCITVDELNSTMLSTSGSCEDGNSVYAENSFPGWRSITSSDGLLIANIKQDPGASGGDVGAALTVNTTGVRTDGSGVPYLDRNFNGSSDATGPADIQLFFTAADFAALNGTILAGGGSAITLADLNVTHQTGTCQADFAQNNGTNSVLTQTANGSVNGADFIQVTTPGFSNFYIMAGTVPLPLKLINFTGQNEGNVNALTWQTAAEKNFSHFELQRSANGTDFSKLDIIQGKNVATGSKYQYNDIRPLEGHNFYRLLLVDLDGRSNVSNTVELTSKMGSGMAVTVHPNPIKDVMQINVAGKIDGSASILIMDIMGKVLKTINPTSNNVSVDMNAMPSGTYIVKYLDNSHSIVTKVIKD